MQKKPEGILRDAIESQLGGFESFKEKFSKLATAHFSNGWAWLVADKGERLRLFTTKDHVSPLSKGMTPLFVLDLWEHAYYLKYQNKRREYIDAAWNLVNWAEVGSRWDEYRKNGETTREWRLAG